MPEEQKAVLVPDYLSVRELAELIDQSPIDVMKTLIANGIMASINQQVDYDTAAIVIEEMGYEARSASMVAAEEEEQKREEEKIRKWEKMYAGEKRENMQTRPPIVTILGHVDHGKTTLLDTIRKTAVVEGESGGITQHIGAYQAQHDGRILTFLDTPGHAAFTAMRARGAEGADIVILVVAADDGVMPQTREALNHARAADVPIIVAITKADKSNANVERVKQQLADLELIPDEWDGDTIMIPVDSLKGEGIDDLLEAIILLADDNDIDANPKGALRGIVVEAEVDKSRGTLATLLVMNGTMKRGDVIVAGTSYGRVKAMFDHKGDQVTETSPSAPVSILGLDNPPDPGMMFEQVKNDRTARKIVEERILEAEERDLSGPSGMTLEDIFAQFQSGTVKQLNVILKVDVQGSLQPIIDGLNEISGDNEEGIEIRILASDIGNITENDVNLAGASEAIILGFHVDVDNAAQTASTTLGVDIRKYSVIYKLFEDIELALKGLLEPTYAPKVIGRAEVREVYKIPRIGQIAGSYILDGEARRNAKARVVRNDDVIVEETKVSSLKRFTEDVREVRSGFECGISLDGFNDYEEGDIIEFFVMERVE